MWRPIQEERYEEEDGADEDILGSNFSPGRNTEVFDLPDVEALFMPASMDSSQMAFKFKEVFLDTCDLKYKSVCLFFGNFKYINKFRVLILVRFFVLAAAQLQHRHS